MRYTGGKIYNREPQFHNAKHTSGHLYQLNRESGTSSNAYITKQTITKQKQNTFLHELRQYREIIDHNIFDNVLSQSP